MPTATEQPHETRLLDLNRRTSSDLAEDVDLQKGLWEALEGLLKPSKAGDEGVSTQKIDAFTPRSLRVSQDRVHEAIFIGGRRGEGKTTILLQVLGKIERGEWPEYRSLGLLDPTLLETKQNLILSIVQRIREYLTHEEGSWRHRNQQSERKLQKALEALRVLAKGISVLDGVGKDVHGEDWSDASFILDEGMERAEAAYGFEQCFRDFVSCAAEAVGCEAFVLCIDDVDTKSEMGGPVLEALRKYLTCPRLRVIVSGDPELLQSLTRKLQLEGLGEKFVNFERNISSSHPEHARVNMLLEQLSGLEDQFLTKVLPPNRRLKLKTLNEITSTSSAHINLKWQRRDEGEFALNKILDNIIIRHWGAREPNTLRRYRSAILSMPVRSIIEFLDVWDTGISSRPLAADVSARMTEIARSQLSDFGLRIDSIQNIPAPEMKMRRIAEWMCQEPTRWAEFSNLVPNGAHEERDRIMLALSSILSGGLLDKTSGIVRYWLLFAFLKDQIELGVFGDYDERKKDLPRFLTHVRYMQDQTLGTLLGYWAGWIRSPSKNTNSNVLMSPTIVGIPVATDRVRNPSLALNRFYAVDYNKKDDWNPLRNKPDKDVKEFLETLPEDLANFHKNMPSDENIYGRSQNTLAGALYNSVEGLAKRLDVTSASILLLPYTLIASNQGYEHGNYSLLSIFAGIVDLQTVREPRRTLASWHANYTYPIARNNDVETSTAAEQLESEDVGFSSDAEIDQAAFDQELLMALEAWASSENLRGVVASSALMAVWKKFSDAVPRLFKNSNAGTNKLADRTIFLGRHMHRQVVIFLHALGVEMYLYEGGQIGVGTQASPTSSDENFFNFLNRIDSQKVAHDTVYGSSERDFDATPGGEFFYHMLECPLWAYFLAPTTYAYIKDYFRVGAKTGIAPQVRYSPPGVRRGRNVEFDSLYYLLNTIVMPEAGGE